MDVIVIVAVAVAVVTVIWYKKLVSVMACLVWILRYISKKSEGKGKKLSALVHRNAPLDFKQKWVRSGDGKRGQV